MRRLLLFLRSMFICIFSYNARFIVFSMSNCHVLANNVLFFIFRLNVLVGNIYISVTKNKCFVIIMKEI